MASIYDNEECKQEYKSLDPQLCKKSRSYQAKCMSFVLLVSPINANTSLLHSMNLPRLKKLEI